MELFGIPRCAIKMNLMKAYDPMEWGFLLDMMRVVDFPVQFITWVEVCVPYSQLLLMVNYKVFSLE